MHNVSNFLMCYQEDLLKNWMQYRLKLRFRIVIMTRGNSTYFTLRVLMQLILCCDNGSSWLLTKHWPAAYRQLCLLQFRTNNHCLGLNTLFQNNRNKVPLSETFLMCFMKTGKFLTAEPTSFSDGKVYYRPEVSAGETSMSPPTLQFSTLLRACYFEKP